MRCSLLVLSSYIDSELEPARRGELEAHLVGCARCSTALGYLREESERLGGLARVHVPEPAAHQLFADLALIAPDDLLPEHVASPRARPQSTTEAPPWLGEQPGKALPWKPPTRVRRAPEQPIGPEPRAVVQPPGAVAVATPPDQLEMPVPMATPFAAPPVIEVEVPGSRVRAEPAPPAMPPRRARAGPVQRIRDAIGLRFALMSGGKLDVEDSIEIVTGTPPAPVAKQPEEAPIATPMHTMIQPDTTRPLVEPMSLHAPAPGLPEVAGIPLAPARPRVPGRHMRSVAHTGRRLRPNWPSRPAVGVPARDRRLWAYGAAVLVLMLIGLLVGKSVSAPRQATAPPATHPSSAPGGHAASPAVPSAAPTPRPTPVPTPSPNNLTGTKTLGGPSSGFVISGLRYGSHPGDFRVVYDIDSDAAHGVAPQVVAGFGGPTTLYIEFSSVSAVGTPPAPVAGNVVTAVRLLSPSPITGRTIYEFTLAHPVKLSAYYLTNGVRLVVDLTY